MGMEYKSAANVDENGVSEMIESARINDASDVAEVERQDARFALQSVIESTEYNVMNWTNNVCKNFEDILQHIYPHF